MNILAKVRDDIDDPLVRELVIDVCLLSINMTRLRGFYGFSFLFLVA
jgi:hypothetical protein